MDKRSDFIEEHEIIERELLELETVMECEDINHANLAHVLRKIYGIWNNHTEKENQFFLSLQQQGIKVPLKNGRYYNSIQSHLNSLFNSMLSGSENMTRVSLEVHGNALISEIRDRMKDAGWILYALPTIQETIPNE